MSEVGHARGSDGLLPVALPTDNPRALGGMIKRANRLADTSRLLDNAKRLIEQTEPAYLKEKEAWEREKAKMAEQLKAENPK